jgi:hypothetical protein
MDKGIELDIEMWDNIRRMILSNDKQSSSLAFGILKNLDPNNELNKTSFERLIEDIKENGTIISYDISKVMYFYYMVYSKN